MSVVGSYNADVLNLVIVSVYRSSQDDLIVEGDIFEAAKKTVSVPSQSDVARLSRKGRPRNMAHPAVQCPWVSSLQNHHLEANGWDLQPPDRQTCIFTPLIGFENSCI